MLAKRTHAYTSGRLLLLMHQRGFLGGFAGLLQWPLPGEEGMLEVGQG